MQLCKLPIGISACVVGKLSLLIFELRFLVYALLQTIFFLARKALFFTVIKCRVLCLCIVFIFYIL